MNTKFGIFIQETSIGRCDRGKKIDIKFTVVSFLKKIQCRQTYCNSKVVKNIFSCVNNYHNNSFNIKKFYFPNVKPCFREIYN